jgi:hypothetical protein
VFSSFYGFSVVTGSFFMGEEILSPYETSELVALLQRNGSSIDLGTVMCAKIFFDFSVASSMMPRNTNNCVDCIREGCTNPELQVTQQTNCCTMASNICGLAVWNLLPVIVWCLEF